jgi:hydrogenase maturation protein HypF
VFDAVAALLGLGSYNHFDAQLPMALESVAEPKCQDSYEFDLQGADDEPLQVDLGRTLRRIVDDIECDTPVGIVAARFHNTLAEALLGMAQAARERARLDIVALSGGVFCNRYLTDRLSQRLKEEGFTVLLNRDVPANDGGLALGQAAIAAEMMSRVE